ncbi:hypothetical protein AB0D49_33680 [Streptomyces sp. NPDC048290]|uniref:hypothetical protein n=1 Tax=Streptomyces sp. NPDC048290 TaxID=3155811 RepID=UPI00342CB76A
MIDGSIPPQQRPPGAKLTIDVYTVDRHGTVVSPPRATVVVLRGHEPLPDLFPRLEPCACPVHRKTGALR